jgi:hypothetical protein
MAATLVPDSPEWWLDRLLKQLVPVAQKSQLLDSYFNCENGVPTMALKAVREAYQRLMRMARTNYAELIVEAVRERIQVNGFRTGAASDELGDKGAWSIWQGNSLDADFALITRAALVMGSAYTIVGDIDEETGVPVITPEDPRQTIAEFDPVRRRKVRAALKTYWDNGVQWAYVYIARQPNARVHVFGRRVALADARTSSDAFELVDVIELAGPNVPVQRYAPQPTLSGYCWGEFEKHLPVLDRISYQLLSRLEIATLQAFKQRAVKGVPSEDKDGKEINYDAIFTSDPGALWVLPATADIWESGAVDLGPIRLAVKDDVQDLAAVTRTPLFYLSPDASNGSAEGASLAREGLIFKVYDRLAQLGESVEATMSSAFSVMGDSERAARSSMEVIWAQPERYSLSERYDAASKAQAAGVTWRKTMQKVLQFTPQEIDEMEAERAGDLLLASSLAASSTGVAATANAG